LQRDFYIILFKLFCTVFKINKNTMCKTSINYAWLTEMGRVNLPYTLPCILPFTLPCPALPYPEILQGTE
jgi:hypothetical protein